MQSPRNPTYSSQDRNSIKDAFEAILTQKAKRERMCEFLLTLNPWRVDKTSMFTNTASFLFFTEDSVKEAKAFALLMDMPCTIVANPPGMWTVTV